MSGPEGQIFGPMAETYAFALGGALLLALTLSPVLCTFLLKNVKPKPDNFLVRWLQAGYLRQLQRCLDHRWLTLAFFAADRGRHGGPAAIPGQRVHAGTGRGEHLGPGPVPLEFVAGRSLRLVAEGARHHETLPETEMVLTQVGRPDDGTDPAGFYNAEFFMPLKPHVAVADSARPRPPPHQGELTDELSAELKKTILSVEWNFSQNIRNMVMESMSGVRGENSVKIVGPDLEELEKAADRVIKVMRTIRGLDNVGAYRIMGQSNLVLPIDRRKCARWNLKVGDVQAVGETAVGGKPFSQMIEGERSFDITLRFPKERRSDLDSILGIPVDVAGNTVVSSQAPGQSATPVSGPNTGPSSTGSSANLPSLTGSAMNAPMNDLSRTPRRRLGDMVTPLGPDGKPEPGGSFFQRGASDIYRDQGERLIAIKFDIHGRDLAGAVAEAQQKCKNLVAAPVRLEWTGEFREMEQAERRLMFVIPLAAGLVVVLLYLAFRSITDIFIVLSNVVAMVCGGIWALLLTHTNFSISAAVGFISIFGVAVMDGLLRVSAYHHRRLEGQELEEAVLHGSRDRLRPS